MQQSSFSEGNKRSANQEISRVLWNPKVHYRIYNNPQTVPILNQIDSFPVLPFQFLKAHFNIILQSTSRSFKRSFSQVSQPKPRMHRSCLLHVPHALPILFFFISSPEYLVRNIYHNGLRYVVFSLPLLPCLS